MPSPSITYLGITWSGPQYTLLPSYKALENVSSLALETLGLRSISQKHYQRLLGSINFLAPYIQYGPLHLRPAGHTDLTELQEHASPTTVSAVPTTPSLVDSQEKSGGSDPNVHSASSIDILDRCLKNRMGGGGGNPTGLHGQRHLDPGGEHSPHQHTGVSGCHSISVQHSPSKVFGNPDQNGQYRSRLPHQQAGIEQKQNPVDFPARPSVSLCPAPMEHPSMVHTRSSQHLGRLSRSLPVRSEWSLSPLSFRQLMTLLFLPAIDLCSLPAFGCPFPFPSATIIDALAANWNKWERIYLFTPPDLIQTCLLKLAKFRGAALVWSSLQYFLPLPGGPSFSSSAPQSMWKST